MKPVVIGNPDFVLGMALAGVSGTIARSAADVNLALDEAIKDKTVAIVLVSADAAQYARERIDQLRVSSIRPLVIEVPGESKETDHFPSLLEMVQRSVGIDLGGK